MYKIKMYQTCSRSCTRDREVLIKDHHFFSLWLMNEKHKGIVIAGNDEQEITRMCPECGEMVMYHFRIVDDNREEV